MLIRFRVSNFLSFKNEVELSMIPGKSRHHPNHIVLDEGKTGIDVLKAAIIYGANASGKSNLIKAIAFARALILEGTKAKENILVRPFKLDHASLSMPSKFEFEIRQNKKNYLYGFEVTSSRIISEWLYSIRKTTEKLLFERKTDDFGKTEVKFGFKISTSKEDQSLEIYGSGTPSNKLFLTECLEHNIERFQDVSDWFASINIIFPGSIFTGFNRIGMQGDFSDLLVGFLEAFDTGICGFVLHPIPKEELPKDFIKEIEQKLTPGNQLIYIDRNRRLIARNDSGEIKSFQLMMNHRVATCKDEFPFSINEESDGTIRLLDLIPILLDVEGMSRIFIIDELDRSLHPSLSYQLIGRFLQKGNSLGQVIATSHDANLLDLDLLRRDEIWFMEKDNTGVSSLYSLEEFSPRYDKDIQKGYLLGRFGAIPIPNYVKLEEQE